MNRHLMLALAAAALASPALPPLTAQSRLYVLEPDGNYHAVFAVRHEQPVIKAQGKLVPSSGQRLMLKKVDEFIPIMVEVSDQQAGTTYLEPMPLGPSVPMRINNQFSYSATFESSCVLDDVFIVLELDFAQAGRRFFPHEIGRLEAWQPRRLNVAAQLDEAMGTGRFILHVFVGGAEVFHSGVPWQEREAALDAMVARRIKGIPDAGPQLLYGNSPRYPAGFRQAGVRGDALVTLKVSARGLVTDATVETASDPAFGEAAVAAVRHWRFVPRVSGGRPVESAVRLPLAFDPAGALANAN